MPQDDQTIKQPLTFKSGMLLVAVIWTLIAGLSFVMTLRQHRQEIEEVALSEAKTAFYKDIIFRLWNAGHGGVYAPVSAATQPNPYLSHIPERDIETPSGRKLTLVNPAYMIRQVHTLGKEKYGILGHLTSLKPINAANSPDDWETMALMAFEQGRTEVAALADIDGEPCMRLIMPVFVDESCLQCHASQGYKIGEIRGGLSVAVPMKPLLTTLNRHVLYNWLGHGLLWTLGLALISMGARKLMANTTKIIESESRYRVLFNNSNDAIFVHGIDEQGLPGRFEEVNDVVCQRLGYTREELLRMSPADLDDPQSQNNLPAIAGQLVDRKNVLFEAVHLTKAGIKIPVEVNAHLFELHGRPTVLAIVRDISERKRSAERLQAERNKLKGILDAMPDGVYIVNQNYEVEYVNPTIEKDFGPVENRKCYSYLHDRTEVCPWCKNQEVFAGKTVRWEWHSDKTGKTYDLFDTPISNSDGQVSKLEIFHDITERKKAEEEKHNIRSQLVQAQKMESIGRLAGGIAHDFNNILTVIIGYSEMTLRALPDDSPLKISLKTIKDSGDRAAALTRQLLAFSRKQLLEMQPVDLNDTVGNMARMFERIIGEDITLELHLKSPLSRVTADRTQIEQVLMNLAVNARDAMPVGGRLIIETADTEVDKETARGYGGIRPGRYVLLAVSDTGTGIPHEIQEKIFEPFFTMKEAGKGTGLGLAMVYGIVKQHGGHIAVVSELGKGATFRIFLPAAENGATASAPPATEPILKGTETVLVVDDDPAIRRLLTDILEPLGYRVLAAADGGEALRISNAFAEDIDMLLTDVIMPGMNGSELAEMVATSRPAIKVIFMSGYPDAVAAGNGLGRPDVAFIQKPLRLLELTKKLRHVLDEKRQA